MEWRPVYPSRITRDFTGLQTSRRRSSTDPLTNDPWSVVHDLQRIRGNDVPRCWHIPINTPAIRPIYFWYVLIIQFVLKHGADLDGNTGRNSNLGIDTCFNGATIFPYTMNSGFCCCRQPILGKSTGHNLHNLRPKNDGVLRCWPFQILQVWSIFSLPYSLANECQLSISPILLPPFPGGGRPNKDCLWTVFARCFCQWVEQEQQSPKDHRCLVLWEVCPLMLYEI